MSKMQMPPAMDKEDQMDGGADEAQEMAPKVPAKPKPIAKPGMAPKKKKIKNLAELRAVAAKMSKGPQNY